MPLLLIISAVNRGQFLFLCHLVPDLPSLLAQLVLLILTCGCAAIDVNNAEDDECIPRAGNMTRFTAAPVTCPRGRATRGIDG